MRTKLKLSYIVYTLLTLSILFSTNNVSALSYQTPVNVSFTFNPTISISISNDLTVPSLTPGTTSNSNEINVNVSTNNAYGYNLYATVGNSTYNNTNLTNSNNNSNTFATISHTANLSSLDTDNTWGYSYSLDNGSNWSNYNGLSLYTTDNPTRLNKTTEPSSDTINFKIAARAGTTQASGEYSNVINFTAITKLAPLTLAESYEAYYNKEGKTKLNGYYVMQDMNKEICENVEVVDSELQVIDNRDNKVYWIAKLKDNHCWMTQNLDLDITASSTALNSNNTDISTDESIYTVTNTIYTLKGESDAYGYTYENGIAAWIPERNTITYSQLNSTTWTNDSNHPYSFDRLNTSTGEPVYPDGNVSQALAGDHGLSGNYYNWTASVASNDSSSTNSANPDPVNSICPKGWRLPNIVNQEFGNLLVQYGIIETNTSITYLEGGFDKMGATSLYLVRGGNINNGSLNNSGSYGSYWSSTSYNNANRAYHLRFGSNDVNPHYSNNKGFGYSIRCLDR